MNLNLRKVWGYHANQNQLRGNPRHMDCFDRSLGDIRCHAAIRRSCAPRPSRVGIDRRALACDSSAGRTEAI